MNIILCGFMGCGKTTIGKFLSKRLNMAFVDLDEAIESREGMAIPEIFSRLSESGFRDIEHEAFSEVLAAGGRVIATGGGALTANRNAELAGRNGLVVFLNPGFEVCWSRIKSSNRPLVKSNTKESLEALHLKREPLYRSASALEITSGSMAGNPDPVNICALIECHISKII